MPTLKKQLEFWVDEMEILIAVVATGCIGLFVFCLAAFIWSSTRIETSPRITFDAFKKLYAISPSKWSFSFDAVSYHSDDGWIHIEFKHYIDVLRYRFLKDKVESDEAYLTLTQNEKNFLASVQKDIDSYRKENLREMERLLQK